MYSSYPHCDLVKSQSGCTTPPLIFQKRAETIIQDPVEFSRIHSFSKHQVTMSYWLVVGPPL